MKKKSNEVSVGVFVILGFIFLTLVLFFVSGVYLFRSGYTVDVMFNYVSILNQGAPVRMAGVRVGEVSKVDIVYDQGKQNNRVKVKLFIEKGVEIRENYAFTIRGTHVLSEPHVEITPKPGTFPLLQKGALLEGVPLVAVEELIDRAHEILSHLADILGKFKAGMDDKGTVEDLKTLIRNLSSLSGALDTSLKPGGDMQQSFKHIESTSASLSGILAKVQKGDGTLGKLLMQDELYKEMEAFVKDVRAHPWKLLKKDSKDGRKWYFLFLA
jgi:phospholipid/cholesterol/gamma-HCH transport system substrate-binding protein